MTPILIFAIVVGAVSLGGAAFLLSLWHEDRASGTRGWPLSRVLAYLAIAGTIAANVLGVVSFLRLLDVPNFREIQVALTPFTVVALLVLDLLFPVLALYLRAVRAASYLVTTDMHLLAREASVQALADKLAALTELVAGKADKA